MTPNMLAKENPRVSFPDATRVVERQSTRKMNRLKKLLLPAGTIPLTALLLASPGFAATETTPAPTVANSPADLATGQADLARASELLDEGEHAQNPTDRRAFYIAAERHADAAAKLLPKSANAHFLRFAARGRLAQMQGLARAAWHLASLQEELDLVLELDPNHADALGSRGGMLVKLPYLLGGNRAKGIQLLQRSVELDPQSVGKRLELAEAYHLDEQHEQARKLLKDAHVIANGSGSTKQIETVKKFADALAKSCRGCELEILPR